MERGIAHLAAVGCEVLDAAMVGGAGTKMAGVRLLS